MFLAVNVHGMLQMFRAEPCPEGKHADSCFRPFFRDSENISVAVFLTANPKLRWWTAEGLAELQGTPLWNISDIAFGLPVPKHDAVVPLSAEPLKAIRRNESRLFAHVFVARSGTLLLNETLSEGEPHKADARVSVLSKNVLHTSEPITRQLPQVARSVRNLLNLSSDANETNETKGMRIELAAGWSIPVFPAEMLKWTGLLFSLTAFASPHPVMAGVRHATFVTMPLLYRLYQQQQEDARLLKRREEREVREWLLGQPPAPIMPHLVPQLQINLPADDRSYDGRFRPPLLYQEMILRPGNPMPYEKEVRYSVVSFSDGAGRSFRRYLPPISIDTWRARQRFWRPLASDPAKEDPVLGVELNIDGMIRYSVIQTMRESVKVYTNFGISERDLEDIWDFMFRHPLHIMALMQVISMAQVTLSTLAFKNDITFFKGRGDYVGLSSRSLLTDTVHEIVIFLYLYDFEEISRLLLVQWGVQALIGAWKFAKVARLGIGWKYLLPWVTYNRQEVAENEKDTEEIDAAGMRMAKYILYPASLCWGLYNLYHYSYKSWWSWLISSLADFAYTFGFVNMLPQIFINYKLKSVAHMPWRVLMYKFFNTFIDDVFAFFIMKDYMTKKHRLMTLRDDIIFFIFLYQRYIYRVDHTRPDEYGNVYADADALAAPETDDAAAQPERASAAEADATGKGDKKLEHPSADAVDSTDAAAAGDGDKCRKRTSCGTKAGKQDE